MVCGGWHMLVWVGGMGGWVGGWVGMLRAVYPLIYL